MGYASIDNLYKNQAVLLSSECFALEKIHGCSSHITYTSRVSDYTDNHGVKSTGNFHYHGGGVSGSEFKSLFDTNELESKLKTAAEYYNTNKVTVYGETYGGKMQKNQWRYGNVLKFVSFDVKFDDKWWLDVEAANSFVKRLNFEFVHFVRIPTKLSEIDYWRDAISEQAIRNGVTTGDPFIPREGIVLRPTVETTDRFGNRVIAKHKRDEERETKTPRKVVNPSKVEMIKEAQAVAEEFVTENRLFQHVLPKLGFDVVDMTKTREVISAMINDINREGAGEFVPSSTVNAEIGKRTAQMLKQYLATKLIETQP